MEHMVNFIKMYLILWKTTHIGFKPQFGQWTFQKLTGNTGDFIMNIFTLMEIPSTKLPLYTAIATKLKVSAALQTFDTLIGDTINLYFFQSILCHQQALVSAVCSLEQCRVSPTDDYLSLRLKHVIETMFSLAA